MLNELIYLFRNPRKGWDPINAEYAISLQDRENRYSTDEILEKISNCLGGLKGKRILDLGGGSGQYTEAFAAAGAVVHWHDVSANYEKIVKSRLAEKNLHASTSLGLLSDIPSFDIPFDFVLMRLCWNYCNNDAKMMTEIKKCTHQNAWLYVDVNTKEFNWATQPVGYKIRAILYNYLNIKIGHPYPQKGKISALIAKNSGYCVIDNSLPFNEIILAQFK